MLPIVRQFGAPSEIIIGDNDVLYVTDSERDDKSDAGNGTHIGSARVGRVTAFVPDARPNQYQELVAVDKRGNLWTSPWAGWCGRS